MGFAFKWFVPLVVALLPIGPTSCSNRADPCGNGRLELDEACDGLELRGETCLSQGFRVGQLACNQDCTLDTSACSQDVECEPGCDTTGCESCFNGTCSSFCQEWEVCRDGSCVIEATQLTFFFTSDEHGWIFSGLSDWGDIFYGGAAEMMTSLRAQGYDPDSTNSILLSDGDMWTGPAISTWYEGESVVEVMNAMGYTAAAVGNHEFDFGLDVLLARSQEAAFPFLAANLKDEVSGDSPAFAGTHSVVEVSGVQVGVIGLAIDGLPYLVSSSNLEGLVETGYEQALRDTVPLALADGAEVLIVISHICPGDLNSLTSLAAELGIVLMTGGHCHSTSVGGSGDVVVVSPGSTMTEFARVDLHLDEVTLSLVHHEAEIIDNAFPVNSPDIPDPDPAIQAIVDTWLERVDLELGEVIGYTETGIDDWPMYNMITDSWLEAVPAANLGVSNLSGFRASYGPGDITRAHTVAVQPFVNYLVEVELTGEQVVQTFATMWPHAISGATVDGWGDEISVSVGGGPIDPAATYRLVTTDYLAGQPDFFPFPVDPEDVIATGLHWRQVTEDWVRAQDSSGEDPLETMLDDTVRWVN